MADAPISYAITTAVFIAFGAICFAARTKRLSGQKETRSETGTTEMKRSPA
jgi:hypothetical protein